jgi:hypothetical protein
MKIFSSLFGQTRSPILYPRKQEKIGLVALSRSCREFTLDELSAEMETAFPGHFLPLRAEGSFVVGDAADFPQFLIKSAIPGMGGLCMLQSVPTPYTLFSDFANHIEDTVLRRLAEAQPSWLALDPISQWSSDEGCYRFLAKALARLAPDDAAVLVHPWRSQSVPLTSDMRRRLQQGDWVF